ncbi:zinc finger, CCHC-type containing protein [Tanacetum coccineum]
MAGNTMKEMTMNFRKLDKFEGHDFRRWKKKMHFLLTTLKVVYVLTTPMPELMEDSTVEAIRIRAKWENDDYICRGHILNGMPDSLFDVYTNVESAKELWDSLESKYMKFLKDFKHTLKHGKDDLSLVQLGSHLRIEESLRAQDSDKGKGKEVAGPSVNMAEEGKNKNNKQNKGKKHDFKEHCSGSGSNKKPKLECWKCGKTSHFKRDCRSGNKKNANAGGSGKGSKDHSQDQGQNLVSVWNRFIKYYVSLISEAFYVQVDAIAWWIDSGATTHVCKDRCWFKTYEPVEDGSVLYMGDDHFAPVHGKGSVVLEFSSGKSITLFNVLYVPKLRKNLISSPVLNKCGYKQVYESDKPNGDALRKCILKVLTSTIVTTPAVPATENSPAVPEQTTVETVMNMTPENRAHFESEKEAIHLILTGIGDEIYSTVDACQTAQEMWEAIERLQQEWSRFVTIVKQQHKLDEVSYHKLFDILKQYQKEVNELRAERMAKNANPLALVATAQTLQDPYYQSSKSHKSYAPTSKASLPTRSHATTRYKGKEIAKPITPPSESASEEDSDSKQAQRDKDM